MGDTIRRIVGLLVLTGGLVTGGLVGCNSGARDGQPSNIPGLVNSAAPLPFDNAIYRGPKLETSRYGHTATTMLDGRVLIAGGTDERHFTSIDSGEIFDQTVREDPLPESITGSFFDLDFNGDPILMNFGGRVFHTATALPDGNVLICGGSFDILVGEAIGDGEIFDRQTRRFSPGFLQISNSMFVPRFRHTATLLSTGRVLIAGGQESVDETIIDPNWPPGHPLFMVDIKTFPSTESMEVFNPSSLSFEQALDLNQDPLELQSVRGRSDHATVQIAGIDNVMGTGDDLYLFNGGIRTLSSLFAPQTKFPGNTFNFRLGTLEYFDRSSLTVNTVNNLSMAQRVGTPRAFNLGRYNRFTPDGVDGVTNVTFFTNGDNDYTEPTGLATSVSLAEMVVANFTGFGPSNGLQFQMATNFGSIGNVENLVSGCPAPTTGDGRIGRSAAPALLMPYERLINGEQFRGSWVVTGGGVHLYPTPAGQGEVLVTMCKGNDMRALEYFDPFYNAFANWDFPDPPVGSSFLDVTAGAIAGQNRGLMPTGVVGAWMFGDDLVPEDSPAPMAIGGFPFAGWGDGNGPIAQNTMPEEIIYHTMSQVPGRDGIVNTRDDRVVIIGGGDRWLTTGGEPVAITCLVCLPPGANDQ